MPPKPTGTYGRPAPHDALRRQGNYSRKVVPAHVGALITALKPGMTANLGATLPRLSRLYSAVAALLATKTGMSAYVVAQYQNFARQVWAARQRHGGKQFVNEAVAILIDWEERGLTAGAPTSPLWAIATLIFGVPYPLH